MAGRSDGGRSGSGPEPCSYTERVPKLTGEHILNQPRPVAEVVGVNIRRLRTTQGLSLSALSRRSTVAKATLSAIESGEGNPTVATLGALSTALRVPLHELLDDVPRLESRVVRDSGASEPGTDDVLIEAFVPRGVVELYDIRYEAGARLRYDGHRDGVVERVLVHEGRLRAGPVDGATLLQPGDFLAFAADRPHVYECMDEIVRGVLVVSYQGAAPADTAIHARSRT